MKLDDPALVAEQYAREQNLQARQAIYAQHVGPNARDGVFEIVAALEPHRVLEVGGGQGELAQRIVQRARRRADVRRSVGANGGARLRARHRRGGRRCSAASVRRRRVRHGNRRVDAVPRSGSRSRLGRAGAGRRAGRPPRRRDERARIICTSCVMSSVSTSGRALPARPARRRCCATFVRSRGPTSTESPRSPMPTPCMPIATR